MIGITHPQTTPEDLKRFRKFMQKCVNGDFTPEEKAWIQRKKEEIKRAGEIIRANNGGKNPILGY